MLRQPSVLAFTLVVTACSSGGGASPSGDAGSKASIDAQAPVTVNDSRCPPAWSADLLDGPSCKVAGLLCNYPQGQAECPPGPASLRWLAIPAGQGCPEPAPPSGAACSMAGGTCSYFSTGESSVLDVHCCDGTSKAWETQPSTGCPNGNTCGTIHASDYDQSCTTAADCVGVADGDFCLPNRCTDCTTALINASAQAQYASDLAAKVSVPAICPCPSGPLPACVQGKCTIDPGGFPGLDAGSAAASDADASP